MSSFLTRTKWTCSPDSYILTQSSDQWLLSFPVELFSFALPGPLASLGIDSCETPGLYPLAQALAMCSNLTPNVPWI